jgi:cation diffusion facilitator family transporter
MDQDDFSDLKGHDHVFVTGREEQSERRTLFVIVLNAVTMVGEITAGLMFGSMALLADGWHMASHVAALGITYFAYRYARRHIANRKYSWGTGKVGSLAGYTSAVLLAVVALLLAIESVHRLVHPVEIDYGPAIVVAIIGLIVNLFSAWLLRGHSHGHDHGHGDHGHGAHSHAHQDHNLKAAYFHVLADALTSLLAIFALSAGIFYGIGWLDPLIGVVGAAVILWWSVGLARGASAILLDEEASSTAADAIRSRLEREQDSKVIDLHLWRVGPAHFALVASIVTSVPRHPDHYKSLLREFEGLAHVTIEILPRAVRGGRSR